MTRASLCCFGTGVAERRHPAAKPAVSRCTGSQSLTSLNCAKELSNFTALPDNKMQPSLLSLPPPSLSPPSPSCPLSVPPPLNPIRKCASARPDVSRATQLPTNRTHTFEEESKLSSTTAPIPALVSSICSAPAAGVEATESNAEVCTNVSGDLETDQLKSKTDLQMKRHL